MNTLIMTIGLPRSGKSTWARQQIVPVVNPDSIRLALHGQPYIASAEPIVWATAKLMVQSLFYAGHAAVILDAVNGTQDRRDEWIGTNWVRLFHTFDTPREVCIERARANNQEYLVHGIERMAIYLEWPSEEEWEEHNKTLQESPVAYLGDPHEPV